MPDPRVLRPFLLVAVLVMTALAFAPKADAQWASGGTYLINNGNAPPNGLNVVDSNHPAFTSRSSPAPQLAIHDENCPLWVNPCTDPGEPTAIEYNASGNPILISVLGSSRVDFISGTAGRIAMGGSSQVEIDFGWVPRIDPSGSVELTIHDGIFSEIWLATFVAEGFPTLVIDGGDFGLVQGRVESALITGGTFESLFLSRGTVSIDNVENERTGFGGDSFAQAGSGDLGDASVFSDAVADFRGASSNQLLLSGSSQTRLLSSLVRGDVEMEEVARLDTFGGLVEGDIEASGHTTLEFTAGRVDGVLRASEGAWAFLSGGEPGTALLAHDDSWIRLYGDNFQIEDMPVADGDLPVPAGRLYGLLEDGTPFGIDFRHAGAVDPSLGCEPCTGFISVVTVPVPEPAFGAGLAMAAVLLAGGRRRRARDRARMRRGLFACLIAVCVGTTGCSDWFGGGGNGPSDVDVDGVLGIDDCAPDDGTRFQLLDYEAVDDDGDGVYVPAAGEVCAGATLPVRYSATVPATPDCNDADPGRFQRLLYTHIDEDGDGRNVLVPSGGNVCAGTALHAPYSDVATEPDCDDDDAAVFAELLGHAGDADGDGVGEVPTTACTDGTLPIGLSARRDLFPYDELRSGEATARGAASEEVNLDLTMYLERERGNQYHEGSDPIISAGPLGGPEGWSIRIGQFSGGTEAIGATFDPDGNILVFGTFEGTVDFDPSRERDLRTSSVHAPGEGWGEDSPDCWVSRYGPDGTYHWTFTFGGPDFDYISHIRAISSDRIFLSAKISNYDTPESAHIHPTIDVSPGDDRWGFIGSPHGSTAPAVIEIDGTGDFVAWRTYFGAPFYAHNYVKVIPASDDRFYILSDEINGPECTISRHHTLDEVEPAPGQTVGEATIEDCGSLGVWFLDGFATADHEVILRGSAAQPFRDDPIRYGEEGPLMWKLGPDLGAEWAGAIARNPGRTLIVTGAAFDSRGHTFIAGTTQGTPSFSSDDFPDRLGLRVDAMTYLYHDFVIALDENDEVSWFRTWETGSDFGYVRDLRVSDDDRVQILSNRLPVVGFDGLDPIEVLGSLRGRFPILEF